MMAGKKKHPLEKSDVLKKVIDASPSEIRKYSHKIWLAGLGAYANAQHNDDKDFRALVEIGDEYEKNASKKLASATDADSRRSQDFTLKELKSKANQTMDKIEKAFDDRLSSALNRLGLGTKSDVDELSERIEVLTSSVEALTKKTFKDN